MDISVKDKFPEFFKKYKYAFLVLLIGVALMLLPGRNKAEPEPEVINAAPENILTIEEQLSQMLSLVKGAGRVQVMLTVAEGEEILYQNDQSSAMSNDTSNIKTETVTVTDADRNQSGLVRQINPPAYQGAIIVCQGAADPVVRLAMVEAVADITGLGADKISVLKMK